MLGLGFLSMAMLDTTGGTVLHVPADYATIQLAVTASNPGDLIQIEPGFYFEGVTLPASKSRLTIQGNGPVTLIGGFLINAPATTIENLRICGGYLWIGWPQPNAFSITSASATNVTLRRNLIENIPGRAWEVSGNCHYFTAESNVIRCLEKTAYVNNPCDGLRIRYNYFEGRYNTFDNSGAPGLSNALYEFNTFVGTELADVARLGMTQTSAFRNNNFFDCPLGVLWRYGPLLNATNNWWGTTNGPLDPLGTIEVAPGDPHPGASLLLNAQPVGKLGARVLDRISGTVILDGSTNIDYFPWALAPISNGYSFPGPAQVWVSPSYSPTGFNDGHTWAVTAFTNIQEGIDAVWTGTVWVLDGTYRLTEPIWIAKGVAVRSVNGPLYTGVEGGYPAVTNRCFYVNHTNAVLDGFTVVKGGAAGSSWPANNLGGGVFCPQGLVQNCIISNNVAGDSGGGVWMAGGALLRNCLVIRNLAGNHGGGVYLHATTGIIQNCTVAFNTAVRTGGGICVSNGSCQVENAIVYFNQAASGADWALTGTGGLASNSTVRYTCSPNDLTTYGPGNVRGHPHFQNPESGDFRLMAASAGFNSGTNAAWMIPGLSRDLIGRPRILEGRVDMGAYENKPNRSAVFMVQ